MNAPSDASGETDLERSPDRATPPSSLARTTVRGAQFAGLGFVTSQGVLFGTYLVLARLITPTDFGTYAAGTIITGFGGLFAEGGMIAALISRRDKIEQAASTAFFSQLVVGVALTVVGLALSPLFGLFFQSDQVGQVTAVLSALLFLKTMMVVPDALLQRRFSFLKRVATEPLGSVAFAATSIALAASGAGAWSLVAGTYASVFVQLVSAWLFAGFRPRASDASITMWRELAAVARPLVLAETIRRASFQIDGLLIGRLAGLAPLGQYRNALRLAQQPAVAFVNVGAYVLLPAFAHLAATPERLTAAARRVYQILIAAALPLSFAALPLGVPVAVILLGPTWRTAGHVISALCGLVLGSSILAVSTEIFKVTGRGRLLVQINLVMLCAIAVTVSVGTNVWGVEGAAAGISLSFLSTACYALWRLAPLINLPLRQLATSNIGAMIATAVMVCVMFGFGAAVDPLSHPRLIGVLLVVAECLVGAGAYAAVLLPIDAARRRDVRALVERLMVRLHLAQRDGLGDPTDA
jgi:O-antigen/teichoic acid export membrane protein